MPTYLIACAYVCVAVSVAWIIGWLCLPSDRHTLFRAAAGAILVNIAAFVVPYAALFALVVLFVCLICSPQDIAGRLQFYCAMLPALPVSVAWTIPFPGINYLYTLNYPAMVGVAVLVPALITMRRQHLIPEQSSGAKTFRYIVGLAVSYFVVISLLDFRETSFTNGLRGVVDVALSYGLIVVVLSNASLIRQASDSALVGLLIGAMFVCAIGLMQEAVHWLLYDQYQPALRSGLLRYDYAFGGRGGGLRIPGTMAPIPFGTFMSLGVSIGLYCLLRRRATGLIVLPIVGFLYCLEGSDSRGAMLGMLVSILLFVGFSGYFRHLRKPLAIGVVCAIALSFTVFDLGSRILEADEYSTFQYRVDLIYNSMDSISRHPFFGTPLYLENPVLELSRQGQGIIDIVNAYLGVTLRYGSVGLFLFIAPLLIVVVGLMRRRRQLEENFERDGELEARLALCLLAGYAITIGTVSLVDRLPEFYWILIALSAGILGQASPGTETAPAVGHHRASRPRSKYSQKAHAG